MGRPWRAATGVSRKTVIKDLAQVVESTPPAEPDVETPADEPIVVEQELPPCRAPGKRGKPGSRSGCDCGSCRRPISSPPGAHDDAESAGLVSEPVGCARDVVLGRPGVADARAVSAARSGQHGEDGGIGGCWSDRRNAHRNRRAGRLRSAGCGGVADRGQLARRSDSGSDGHRHRHPDVVGAMVEFAAARAAVYDVPDRSRAVTGAVSDSDAVGPF
ncbi:Mycobacterium terramassiliense ORFan [Mycobacterium terramassiliense]|uniref:Mycobacterium terramassiliense ORFan n=1 Tax=Mycobacterium terramassiliense TaxID=1841859 RepID=A0A2U3NEN9_9MYCO|nr:Mycobacterium terramassiliense ORFan [Mycobacterium terramassiliense]